MFAIGSYVSCGRTILNVGVGDIGLDTGAVQYLCIMHIGATARVEEAKGSSKHYPFASSIRGIIKQ